MLYSSVFQLEDRFTLDFDRVPLGQKSRLELAIKNLTDIQSGIKAKIAKFKTRVSLIIVEKFCLMVFLLFFFEASISCKWTE